MGLRISAWLLRPGRLWMAATWGFAEGTLFFFVPDIILTATALFSIRASLKQMAAATVGALVGGGLLFGLAGHNPSLVRDIVQSVPFVGRHMFETVERDFTAMGVWGMLKGPMSGVPYKVYAASARPYASWLTFLLASAPARLERFILTWALFALIGFRYRREITSRPAIALACHAVFWSGVYGYYWSVI